MPTKNILLITGGSGYLGQHLTPKAAEMFEVYTTYHANNASIKAGQPVKLNLTQRDEVLHFITHLAPQAIIHTAAINPGGDETAMMAVNAWGSRYVAEGAAAVGARLVHVSSDVLHDGRHAPYADEAVPSPLNLYGQSKAVAEATVTEVNPSVAIVRTSLIYGLKIMDRGTEGFVKRLKSGQPLVLFNDVIRQPIWADSLAEALLKLVTLDFTGIINIAGRQALTREEFGRRMLRWWQIAHQDKIETGRAADVSDTIPLDLRLSISKAERLLQMVFPGVDEVLSK